MAAARGGKVGGENGELTGADARRVADPSDGNALRRFLKSKAAGDEECDWDCGVAVAEYAGGGVSGMVTFAVGSARTRESDLAWLAVCVWTAGYADQHLSLHR